MDEMPGSGAQWRTGGKQPHFIAHAGAAHVRHPDTGFNGLWKCQRRKVVAARLHHQANGVSTMDVQRALLYQVCIHCGIKPAVIHRVVHMPIDIVVTPAAAYGAKDRVGKALLWLDRCWIGGWGHAPAFCPWHPWLKYNNPCCLFFLNLQTAYSSPMSLQYETKEEKCCNAANWACNWRRKP